MTVEKKQSNKKLTLYVAGRVDTITSPDLEKVITESIANISELSIDLSKTEYISSAGLRVILGAQKAMAKQGTMYLVNVPDTIKEIFDLTGFSEILNIL